MSTEFNAQFAATLAESLAPLFAARDLSAAAHPNALTAEAIADFARHRRAISVTGASGGHALPDEEVAGARQLWRSGWQR